MQVNEHGVAIAIRISSPLCCMALCRPAVTHISSLDCCVNKAQGHGKAVDLVRHIGLPKGLEYLHCFIVERHGSLGFAPPGGSKVGRCAAHGGANSAGGGCGCEGACGSHEKGAQHIRQRGRPGRRADGVPLTAEHERAAGFAVRAVRRSATRTTNGCAHHVDGGSEHHVHWSAAVHEEPAKSRLCAAEETQIGTSSDVLDERSPESAFFAAPALLGEDLALGEACVEVASGCMGEQDGRQQFRVHHDIRPQIPQEHWQVDLEKSSALGKSRLAAPGEVGHCACQDGEMLAPGATTEVRHGAHQVPRQPEAIGFLQGQQQCNVGAVVGCWDGVPDHRPHGLGESDIVKRRLSSSEEPAESPLGAVSDQ
mmetsp:Transcript_2266/g.6572  ORF Transcript_2266/g.6572 Transcript_2266/m.6572 type:complete len:368 (-) Transcript_2266:1606-2709(-)